MAHRRQNSENTRQIDTFENYLKLNGKLFVPLYELISLF